MSQLYHSFQAGSNRAPGNGTVVIDANDAGPPVAGSRCPLRGQLPPETSLRSSALGIHAYEYVVDANDAEYVVDANDAEYVVDLDIGRA